MGWIQSIFSGNKEKECITNLALLADAQNAFDTEDHKLLAEFMNFTPSTKESVDSLLEKYRSKLPESAKDKFSVVFYLVKKLMTNGALSDKKESLIQKLISGLDISREKGLELVSFLKMNIRNGLTEEDSFSRLGYLLERPKYA